MSIQTPSVAIVLPCCNEEEILTQTDEKIGSLIEQLINKNLISQKSFIIYVDDGSTDKTWGLIQNFIDVKENRVGIKFSRNFGHQSALLAGITNIYQQVDCVITIDADLKDDINVIEKIKKKYIQGFEVVYGVRKKRATDLYFKKKTAIGFYILMKNLGVNIIYNHADFRLASSRVCENLLTFGEVNLFLRGIFPLVGFSNTQVFYDRLERTGGKTKFPFGKMMAFALDGITSFSVKPLRIVSLVSIILSFYSLYAYFFSGTVPGWTSIILPIYFIGGVQIFCVGVIGEYIGKIYQEVNSRSRFIIEKKKKKNKV